MGRLSSSDSGSTELDATTPVAAPVTVDAEALQPGAIVSRYHVLERIGAGGMGIVYAAFDPDLDRKVALKVLQPDRLDGDGGSRGHARLIREAKAMAKLAHPNVVTVHDVGVFEERVFVAMEFVDGQTLSAWLKQERPWDEVVRCFIAAGRGLAAAHARGLVHRDFKPDNVLIGNDGRPRVLDFGLARSEGISATDPQEITELDEVSLEVRMRSHDDFDNRITRTGGLTGTPAYMAPEQYLSKPLDARTDQFSFCVALWEGLHGARPFQGDSTAALGLAVCSGEITPPPSNSPLPARIQRALDKGLSQQPGDRFEAMNALLAAIAPEQPSSKRSLWIGAGGITLALGTYAAVSAPTEDPCRAGDERLAKVWNEAGADGLRAAFVQTDAPFATDSASVVIKQLDDYGKRWAASYRDACEATHVRKEQSSHALDLRMSCLSSSLGALTSTVEALQGADVGVVQNAPRAISRLPSLDTCDDTEALGTWARPPDDPELASRVQLLREHIAGLTARSHLERGEDETAEAEDILLSAEATKHRPLIAEAQFLAARVAIVRGQHEAGVAKLEEAVYAALASDHDLILARAFTQLTQATGILQSDYVDGLRWAKQAEAALIRLENDEAESANYHAVMCKLLADKGDTDDALPHCHRTVEIQERLTGEASIDAAHAHEGLGIAYFYGDQLDQAQAEFELARDSFAAFHGETHPDLARVANSLAAVCFKQRGPAECVALFEDAVQRASASYGDDHPMTADFRNNLAVMLVNTGQVEAARASARQALASRRAMGDGEHPGVAASLRILAQADHRDGDLESARKTFEEALAIARRTRGEQHRDIVAILDGLTAVALDAGQPDTAREHLDALKAMSKALDMQSDTSAHEETLRALEQPQAQASAQVRSAERSAGTR